LRRTEFLRRTATSCCSRSLEFSLPPGGIVGVIGTERRRARRRSFGLSQDRSTPDAGTFKVGSTVKLGYVDQSRDSLNADKTIFDEISDGLDFVTLGKKEMNARAYVSRFNFSGTDQQKRVGQLSGGERNRVHLAKMLKSGCQRAAAR
jgi:ATPase subunit of ABC transporter with duplicated ATPase domains